MEREVHAVLGPVGVNEKVSRQVASCLRDVEFSTGPADEGTSSALSSRGVRTSFASEVTLIAEKGGELRWAKEVGLAAFLLQFGEGLEDVSTVRMYASAFIIGLGYLVGGLIPLMPYFFEPIAHIALIYSCVLTGLVLLIFGVVKARVQVRVVTIGARSARYWSVDPLEHEASRGLPPGSFNLYQSTSTPADRD